VLVHIFVRVIHIIHNSIHRHQLSRSTRLAARSYQEISWSTRSKSVAEPNPHQSTPAQQPRGEPKDTNNRSETPLLAIPERSFAAPSEPAAEPVPITTWTVPGSIRFHKNENTSEKLKYRVPAGAVGSLGA
jgi:hypothetical protein